MKLIPGYSRYFITRDGTIFSMNKDGSMKKLKISINNAGYTQVCLYDKVKTKGTVRGIHYWLALVYIPNPLNLKEINHINKVRTDNSIENLEWSTRIDNLNRSCFRKNQKANWFIKTIVNGVEYPSRKAAHEATGIPLMKIKAMQVKNEN